MHQPERVGLVSAGLLASKPLGWPYGSRPEKLALLARPPHPAIGGCVFFMCVGEKRSSSVKSSQVIMDVKGCAPDSLLSLSPQLSFFGGFKGAGREEPR